MIFRCGIGPSISKQYAGVSNSLFFHNNITVYPQNIHHTDLLATIDLQGSIGTL